MGINTIEKWSLGYFLLKSSVSYWHNWVFYKKVVLHQTHHIPKGGHVIFTPIHQNALMDAMALVCNLKSQPVFLARSDIFKKPFMARILYGLKILPVYRIRDGFDTLKKNDAIFDKTIDVIKNKRGLVVLPEGNHDGHRRLRDLKKGFARIAFQTEEANHYELDMKIVPVGLDYSSYESSRSTLLVNFGPPLPVSTYYDAYKESPVKAINQIKDDLSNRLKSLMVHIENTEFYEFFNELRDIGKYIMQEKLGHKNVQQPLKLAADRELIRILDHHEKTHHEDVKKMQSRYRIVKKYLRKFRLSYDVLHHKGGSPISGILTSLALFLTSPVFIYGLINNILPYRLSVSMGDKMKDPAFRSSIKFLISFLLFPIFNVLQALIIKIFFPWSVTGIYFISVPLTGIASYYWLQVFKITRMNCTYRLLKTRAHPRFLEMVTSYDELTSWVRNLAFKNI